jgi:hypothetical protein
MLIEEEINLMSRMLQPEKCEQGTAKHKTAKPLKWMGTVFKLVELGYALHCSKCFGEISLTDLFAAICEMFDVEVKNFSRIFTEIKKRAGDRTIFLDKLKKKLMEYMESSDMK